MFYGVYGGDYTGICRQDISQKEFDEMLSVEIFWNNE